MKKRLLSLLLLVVLCVTAMAVLSSCGEETYTVTFAGEGITLPASQTVKSGECATEPQAPVKEGYTFLGWYVEGVDEPYRFSLPVVADLTLTARFEKNVTYTITFTGEGVSVPAQTVAKGGKVTTPAVPTREGYTFLGWYVEGVDTPYDFDAEVNSELTLTARFEAKASDTFTVTFAGESVNIPAQTVAVGGKAIKPKSPVRAGYVFRGWFLEGADTAFDFDTVITADITLYARYDMLNIEDGTPAHPFLIRTVDDFIAFAERINNPDEEGNAVYRTACYRLEADLDLTGRTWIPVGKKVTTEDEDGNEVTLNGFSGTFDGNGHTIANLTVSRTMRSAGVTPVGLFGVAERAYFHDFTLKDIHYTVESYAPNTAVGTAIGGVVGQAELCTFRNIRVEGVIDPALCAENPAYIGGIVGYHATTARDGQAYISYIQNCSVDLEIKNGINEEGDPGDMRGAVTGGIAGYVTTYGCAAAIVNCTVAGTIKAGRYTGGVVGYISGNYVSIVNCANYAPVTSTSTAAVKDPTYTGGILGYSSGNNTVMDCYSAAAVKGEKSGNSYKSYAGGIVGYASEDDYEYGYSAGIAVINCYYRDTIRTYNVKNTAGVAKNGSFVFDAAFAKDILHWDIEEMLFDGKNIAIPQRATADTVTYHLTLKDGDDLKSYERVAEDGFFATVGAQTALKNRDGDLFFDWEHEAGVRYRFYVPVIKDMTLTARFESSAPIEGAYTGTYTFHEERDAGTLVLGVDGSVEWTMSGTVRGKYTFDGKNVIFEFYNNYGEVCGIFENDELTFKIDAGMSGEVPYVMKKSTVRFGSYWSADGDTLSFSGRNGFSFRSENVKGNSTISGTYEEIGNRLIFKGLSDYFSSAEATANEDGTLTLDFVSNGSAGKTLDSVAFRKLATPDYEGKGFLGSYNMAYIGQSGDLPSQEEYTVVFEADGTLRYINKFGENLGYYYVFREDSYIVLTLEGYTSIFHYDATYHVIYGRMDRGMSSRVNMMFTPVADGAQRFFTVDKDRTALIVTDAHVYYIRKGQFELACDLTPDLLTDGARVTLDGRDYRVIYYPEDSEAKIRHGYGLTAIGAEEGSYTWGGLSVILDGIGNVTGTKTGTYRVLPDGRIVVLFDDDAILGFRYADAKEDGNVVTPLTPDRYQGVYYREGTWSDVNGNTYTDRRYYKLVIDGFGYTAVLYHANGEEYRYNWGSSTWASYAENGYGIHAEYNDYQKIDFLFYYDGQVAYTKSFGAQGGERSFAKAGYEGPLTPPALPAGLEGKYTGVLSDGTSVVFNFKSDLTGTYRGTPFAAVYDGVKDVCFLLDGTLYRFDVGTKVLSYGDEEVTLTPAGEITDVLPEGVCGTWSGDFGGYGGGKKTVTVILSADGTVTYDGTVVFEGASYDVEKGRITATLKKDDTTYTITLTWDPEEDSLSAKYVVETTGESYPHECKTLTRQTA